ncbi:hypothetical protein NM61106_1032 [Neisseria meningitidis 61106]|nr:hypothetical protein NM61106_1032 [Neisseria meningitidis 61106]
MGVSVFSACLFCGFDCRYFFAEVFDRGSYDGDKHCFADAPLGGTPHQVAFCAGMQGGGLGGGKCQYGGGFAQLEGVRLSGVPLQANPASRSVSAHAPSSLVLRLS